LLGTVGPGDWHDADALRSAHGAELMAMRVADTTLALLDEAELQQQAGNAAAAAKARDAFLRAWPERELPTPIRERWVASLPGSGAGASR
jgi:hypothetical protein